MNPSLGDLDAAWYARLNDDAAFAAALGLDSEGDLRLYRGWPKELLAKPVNQELPRVTFIVTDRRRLTSFEPPQILIQSDVWAWPDDAAGALATINAIDDRMLELLGDETAVTWYDAARDIAVSSVMLEGGDPNDVLPRRRRLWQVAPA